MDIHRPRIIVVAAALPPPVHGQSIITKRIIDELELRGADLELFDLSPGTLSRGFRYHFSRAISFLKYIIFLIKHKNKGYIRVYTVLESGFGVIYNFCTCIICGLFGIDVFIHHHTSKHTKRYDLIKSWLFNCFSVRQFHIVLSDEMSIDLKRLYEITNITRVSHNAAHVLERDEPNFGAIRSNFLNIGMLGNLSQEKGLDLAILTAQNALAAGLNFRIIFAGPLVDNRAKESMDAAKRVLGDRLVYLGQVGEAEKVDFFRKIDILWFPSVYKFEAQPVVILEAMSFGIPVITNLVGYISELVGSISGTETRSVDTFPESALGLTIRFLDLDFRKLESLRVQTRFLEMRNMSLVQLTGLVKAIADV